MRQGDTPHLISPTAGLLQDQDEKRSVHKNARMQHDEDNTESFQTARGIAAGHHEVGRRLTHVCGQASPCAS
jgi:hypothetical protein